METKMLLFSVGVTALVSLLLTGNVFTYPVDAPPNATYAEQGKIIVVEESSLLLDSKGFLLQSWCECLVDGSDYITCADYALNVYKLKLKSSKKYQQIKNAADVVKTFKKTVCQSEQKKELESGQDQSASSNQTQQEKEATLGFDTGLLNETVTTASIASNETVTTAFIATNETFEAIENQTASVLSEVSAGTDRRETILSVTEVFENSSLEATVPAVTGAAEVDDGMDEDSNNTESIVNTSVTSADVGTLALVLYMMLSALAVAFIVCVAYMWYKRKWTVSQFYPVSGGLISSTPRARGTDAADTKDKSK